MKILALDTSSDACTVAAADGESSATQHLVEPRAHTRRLIPMIEAVLREVDIAAAELDAVVLGNGPGSFIGMRIGASVAQGIAYGAGAKIVPVSSLAVIAAEVFATRDAQRAVVIQDARMGEVYLEEFVKRDDGVPVSAAPVCLHPVTEGIDAAAELAVALGGEGWHRHPELLQRSRRELDDVDVRLPNARWLLDLGRAAAQGGAGVAPENLLPEYVRTKVASPSRPQVPENPA